jgi:hypothetical protein
MNYDAWINWAMEPEHLKYTIPLLMHTSAGCALLGNFTRFPLACQFAYAAFFSLHWLIYIVWRSIQTCPWDIRTKVWGLALVCLKVFAIYAAYKWYVGDWFEWLY